VLESFVAFLLDRPREIRGTEADRAAHARELSVVGEEDAAPSSRAGRSRPEIEKDAFKAVVAVQKGEAEASSLLEQARQDVLGLLLIELDEVADARLVEGGHTALNSGVDCGATVAPLA
jgi:hypothetical protein